MEDLKSQVGDRSTWKRSKLSVWTLRANTDLLTHKQMLVMGVNLFIKMDHVFKTRKSSGDLIQMITNKEWLENLLEEEKHF